MRKLNRYKIDQRIGCIGIIDTHHEFYQNERVHGHSELNIDDPDVVEYKMGEFNNDKWELPIKTVIEIEILCDKLNKIPIIIYYSDLNCEQGFKLLKVLFNDGNWIYNSEYKYFYNDGTIFFGFHTTGELNTNMPDNWQLILQGYKKINGQWELIGHDWCFEDDLIGKVSIIPNNK